MIKNIVYALIIVLVVSGACSKVSPDAVELEVDFTWEGFVPCGAGSHPEIQVGRIPDETKILVVKLSDHGLSHGKQSLSCDGSVIVKNGSVIVKNGSVIIKKGRLDKIESPCPIGDPGRYKYKIEALNEDKVIIGTGSRTRFYPE